jgi:hypothetical protein
MPRWPDGLQSPAKQKARKAERDARRWARIRESSGKNPLVPGNLPVGTVQALDIKAPKYGLKIAYIPDAQVLPGVPIDHLVACGHYLADKRPDVIVCGGDFWDLPSLSVFGRGTMEFEGRRYVKDVDAGRRAMDAFMAPIQKARGYRPYLEFIEGNHENHIRRAVNDDAKLEGLMSISDLGLAEHGWRQHLFLQPVSIGGVAFCHYFPSGSMGRPITKASQILAKLHMSAVAGHLQGKDIAFARRADGGHMAAIIAGSFYQHEYKFLSPFTNAHWRGMLMLHEVKDGTFDEMFVSINFLKRRFG